MSSLIPLPPYMVYGWLECIPNEKHIILGPRWGKKIDNLIPTSRITRSENFWSNIPPYYSRNTTTKEEVISSVLCNPTKLAICVQPLVLALHLIPNCQLVIDSKPNDKWVLGSCICEPHSLVPIFCWLFCPNKIPRVLCYKSMLESIIRIFPDWDIRLWFPFSLGLFNRLFNVV